MELKKAVEAIKSSDTISFNSYITNEEAKILQTIKEKTAIKLINEDAYAYQNFLSEYSKVSGRSLFSATNETLKNSDTIVMIGTKITRDNPLVQCSVDMAVTQKKANFIYMHPIDDSELIKTYNQFIKYEAGSEEGVIALLAYFLIQDAPEEYKEYLEDLDIGNLSGDCSVGEEEIEAIVAKLKKSQNNTLVIGEDIYAHEQAKNIAKLVGLIDRCTDFNVMLIPSQINTLGVSLICDLDKDRGEKVVGYNCAGDFVISSEAKGDIQVPALNQQEGTFVNIDKRVVNTNVTLAFDGYCLNDIANELLGLSIENTTNYTKVLPNEKGFKDIKFDELGNGYDLEEKTIEYQNVTIDEVSEIGTYNGTVVYRCTPLSQFNTNARSKNTKELIGSAEFAKAAKIQTIDIHTILLLTMAMRVPPKRWDMAA